MKTLNLNINIPDGYNYLAIQPYGDIMLFKNKPRIDPDKNGEGYWAIQDDEISIFGDGNPLLAINEVSDWRSSLRKI